MPGTSGDGRGHWARATALLVLPGLLALVLPLIGAALPEDSVASQGAAAILCMAPAWCCALWLPWSVVGGWRTGWWGPATACAVLALATLGRPVPWVAQDGPPSGDAVRVLVVNVNAFSDVPDPERLGRAIAESGADLAVVIEKRALAVPGMTRVADNFDDDLPRISHASAVFCREPAACPSVVSPEFGSESQRMPVTLTRLPAHAVCLVGAHAPPPVPLNSSGLRPHVQAIADRLQGGALRADWGPCQAGDGVVLAGDLNAVPRSPVVGLLHAVGLRDALDGAGVFAASWPAGGGWPDLPVFQLDHLLVGRAHVADVQQLRVPASDHIGLLFTTW
jgi:endonuclease/exonuclease/phosphatase (EEP) superfamily protein YafD